jgi:hypothetical protein
MSNALYFYAGSTLKKGIEQPSNTRERWFGNTIIKEHTKSPIGQQSSQ